MMNMEHHDNNNSTATLLEIKYNRLLQQQQKVQIEMEQWKLEQMKQQFIESKKQKDPIFAQKIVHKEEQKKQQRSLKLEQKAIKIFEQMKAIQAGTMRFESGGKAEFFLNQIKHFAMQKNELPKINGVMVQENDVKGYKHRDRTTGKYVYTEKLIQIIGTYCHYLLEIISSPQELAERRRAINRKRGRDENDLDSVISEIPNMSDVSLLL